MNVNICTCMRHAYAIYVIETIIILKINLQGGRGYVKIGY